MQIQHLINGAAVKGASYFETVNPATQECWRKWPRREAEIDAAVAARKRPSPLASRPATERAALLRKLGDLIARHVPRSLRPRPGTRPAHRADGEAADPRSADNFYYFAEMCVRVDATPTDPDPFELHAVSSRGVCALISPWNVPFMTSTWKTAPALAFATPPCSR